jgi:hypothetical protein
MVDLTVGAATERHFQGVTEQKVAIADRVVPTVSLYCRKRPKKS